MKILLAVAVVLWILYRKRMFLLTLFERVQIRNALVPRPFVSSEWGSAWLDAKIEEAEACGLTRCESFFTVLGRGWVKGYVIVYQCADGSALVSLQCMRMGKNEVNRVDVQTRFSDGTARVTGDGFMMPDITGGTDALTLYGASLSALLEAHQERALESGKPCQRATPQTAFSILEGIEADRAERMVRDGYAKWADAAHTTLRRTLKGTKATLRAAEAEKARLIQESIAKSEQDWPAVLCSAADDGRVWFTTVAFPPLQILPVAGNQCRAAQAFAVLLSHKLAEAGTEFPCEVVLERRDMESVPKLKGCFSPERIAPGGVRVRLEMRPAPGEEGPGGDPDDRAAFVTPVPSPDWRGSADDWLYDTLNGLGMEPPAPLPASTYEEVLSRAIAQAKQALPSLRDRFRQEKDRLNFGVKFGLKTRSGGVEYVWGQLVGWPTPASLECVLSSVPCDCAGYTAGQNCVLPLEEVVDYCVGSERGGVVDPGYTQRVAEDYGRVVG